MARFTPRVSQVGCAVIDFNRFVLSYCRPLSDVTSICLQAQQIRKAPPRCVKLALQQTRQRASLRFFEGPHSRAGDFDLPRQPPTACVTQHVMKMPVIRESSPRLPSLSPVG